MLGMRNEVDAKVTPVNLVHRQRGAVQRDRSLGRDETVQRLRRLDLEESNPAVIRGPDGTLLQVWLESSDARSGLSELSIRSWIFIPVSAWEDLRGRRGLSLREIGMACWGFLDAVEGEKVLAAWSGSTNQKQSQTPKPKP